MAAVLDGARWAHALLAGIVPHLGFHATLFLDSSRGSASNIYKNTHLLRQAVKLIIAI